ncbi:Uncharacterized membrane protein YdjX, TVP38/TMEM64 family, SNARE-associated domain [Anaerovirgula multivorans]|uniref:TVP38/TMEM64 family membrane protein n=1 Tax=Anaerovirgula multivorans TaxID=312168 RepID=A0A239HRN1_9FIRM|nr:TVP38/TMEM64 family protein [Anaerovirgula multivorans]SNS83728.1 Uncharacterized membrane protein YdjX, TVP38/TMEM64 family, SNARE-associated domain [Anaerovirgula multivorans]
MNNSKSNRGQKVIVLGTLLIGLICYFTIPTFNALMNQIVQMFATGDFEVVREFVSSYGPFAMVISTLLMILAVVFPPLPAFMITFANANLFGWWQGALLSWVSAMAGAAAAFYLARLFGREFVEKLTTKTGLSQVDEFFEAYGKQSILIARLLPFLSFGVVSYAGGLTPLTFGTYFMATGIGQTPATLIYSYVGGMLTGGARMFVTGLLIIFAISILASIIHGVYRNRQSKNRDTVSVKTGTLINDCSSTKGTINPKESGRKI